MGKAFYRDTAMGGAMGEPAGFVKVIVEKGKILGGHIIGPETSSLIQEIVRLFSTMESADVFCVSPLANV